MLLNLGHESVNPPSPHDPLADERDPSTTFIMLSCLNQSPWSRISSWLKYSLLVSPGQPKAATF